MTRPLYVSMFALVLAFGVGPLTYADQNAQSFLKARHDHYHSLGDAFKVVRDASRESAPDWPAIVRAAQKIEAAAREQDKWFPAGTGPEAGKTRALPVIWQKPAEFEAAKNKLSAAAPRLLAAAQASDAKALRVQFAEVGQACKNCHDNFRSPEEHH